MADTINVPTNLYGVAVSILEMAKGKVPVETGSLRNSGKIDEYDDTIRVSFGTGMRMSADSKKELGLINYASYVHEGHDSYEGGKYLYEAALAVENICNSDGFYFKCEFKLDERIGANSGCVAVYLSELNPRKTEETDVYGNIIQGKHGIQVGGSFSLPMVRSKTVGKIRNTVNRLTNTRNIGEQVIGKINRIENRVTAISDSLSFANVALSEFASPQLRPMVNIARKLNKWG